MMKTAYKDKHILERWAGIKPATSEHHDRLLIIRARYSIDLTN
jgi:hypothetical protein